MKRQKICIIATDGHSLYNFRGALIRQLVSEGHDVLCVSIESPEEMISKIEPLGARYYQVAGNRTGIGVFDGLKMIDHYRKLFKQEKPDVCLLYMSKPIAFGGFAAILCKVKHINILVNGLENAYYRTGLKDAIVRMVMSCFYKIVANRCDTVFFHNHDDEKFFLEHRLLTKDNACVVGGSGVDMEHFSRTELPDRPVFLMVARLLWSKGIREYLSAVEIVKQQCPEAKVLLVGGLDENDEALSKDELDRYISNCDIDYCGFFEDVRPFLNSCSVFVLPSYHEGLPRSVIEAMSVGRPIITTDVPGCRETVMDGYNGYLVPKTDSEALANKMLLLCNNVALRSEMAGHSYEMCKERFDVKTVNRIMIDKMMQ